MKTVIDWDLNPLDPLDLCFFNHGFIRIERMILVAVRPADFADKKVLPAPADYADFFEHELHELNECF